MLMGRPPDWPFLLEDPRLAPSEASLYPVSFVTREVFDRVERDEWPMGTHRQHLVERSWWQELNDAAGVADRIVPALVCVERFLPAQETQKGVDQRIGAFDDGLSLDHDAAAGGRDETREAPDGAPPHGAPVGATREHLGDSAQPGELAGGAVTGWKAWTG